MNFDIFKRFFNIRRRNRGDETDSYEDLFKDSESPETWIGIDKSEFSNDDFETFGNNTLFNEASELFKHFEEMIRNIRLTEFPSSSFGQQCPQIENVNPRDEMLKAPDFENPRNENFFIGSCFDFQKDLETKLDSDLDDKVAKGGLSQFFNDKNSSQMAENLPHQYSFNSFVSIRTITSTNGKTRERSTVKDGQGNVRTSVRRSLGDQTHVLTTTSQADGAVDRREDFVNLEPENLERFDQQWRACD